MDRDTKRLLYSLLSGVVSVVGLNVYHFRCALRDGVPFLPLTNLYDYEAPLAAWGVIAGIGLYLAGALFTGAIVYALYRAAKSAD